MLLRSLSLSDVTVCTHISWYQRILDAPAPGVPSSISTSTCGEDGEALINVHRPRKFITSQKLEV